MGKKLYVGNLTYGITDSDAGDNCSPRTARCSRPR